ncbi:SURF1 family cytochrome oxidase biogenesis protein, partial [Zoogloea ramigera]|uniref:SURF1 family cytochrome oxidase biogenesis protein n=1 Tax=Zoogloea ramigera TaxID=350 RepID=UPI003FA269A9
MCARLRHATSGRRFRPSLAGALVALVVGGGCIALGNWQYAKFERKEAAQAQLDHRAPDAPIALGGAPVSALTLRPRPVVVRV